jgi:hypothetical protein
MDSNIAWNAPYLNEVITDNAHTEQNFDRLDVVVRDRTNSPRFESSLERACSLDNQTDVMKSKEFMDVTQRSLCNLTMEQCTLTPRWSQSVNLLHNSSPRKASKCAEPPRTPPSASGRKRRPVEMLASGCNQAAYAASDLGSLSPRKRIRRFPRRNSVVIQRRDGGTISMIQDLITACRPPTRCTCYDRIEKAPDVARVPSASSSSSGDGAMI